MRANPNRNQPLHLSDDQIDDYLMDDLSAEAASHL
jgi:hypothetical protein